MDKIDIRINTKHIVKNDVFFCFINAEKYLTNDIFDKVSKMYVGKGFFQRIKNYNQIDIQIVNTNINKIIELKDDELFDKLVYELKNRYQVPKNLFAITGTKGKTSTSWYVMQFLGFNQIKCGYIGTLGVYFNNGSEIVKLNQEDTLTTPDIDDLYRYLAELKQLEAEKVVFEVSSHSLQQGRIAGLSIDVAGFTNLSQDHLDYHKTMDEYFNAKSLLFSKYLKKSGFAIVNSDDGRFEQIEGICKTTRKTLITFGRSESADLQILNVKETTDFQFVKLLFGGKIFDVKTRIIGEFQAYNIAMAMMFACKSGIEFDKIVEQVEFLQAPLGRMQRVKNSNIFIDYSHTPQSLKEGLKLLSGLYNQVVVVFGCGGDRDKQKRPIMFEIARRIADKVVITNDNPRTENDEKIIEDILCFESEKENNLKNDDFVKSEIEKICGEFPVVKSKEIVVEKDRAVAIKIAVDMYKKCADNSKIAVLIAGKGHEDYQIIGTKHRHFSDYEEVVKNLD